MEKQKIVIDVTRQKRRPGVMPTKRERDRKNDYQRRPKHPKRDAQASWFSR